MSSSPKEIALQILAKPEAERLSELTEILEMVQAAIVIRSHCRDKIFISMSGGEDSGTKFDRLLKKIFGMEWKDTPSTKRGRRSDSKGEKC